MNITAIIPAHDEAGVIARTISNLRAATPPPDSIIVIADGCTDSTAQVAAQSGAMVFQCNEGSKGGALKWLFAQDLADLKDPRGLDVIFDADSIVSPNFFAEVRHAFKGGAQATQGFVSPVIPTPSMAEIASQITLAMTVPALAAYSEVLSQVFDDEVRSRLGWGVPLRGTGMAFRTELLRELLPHVHTRTEDIELSLLLAQRGVRVKFLSKAVVYDPKPPDAARVSRQRARWLQGQAQVWRSYWRVASLLLLRGPEMWWLLSALLLKPKTLFVFLKALIVLCAIVLPMVWWLKILLSAWLMMDVVYYVVGLSLVPSSDRVRYTRAMFIAPLYLWIWIKSLMLALRSRAQWLSVRHE